MKGIPAILVALSLLLSCRGNDIEVVRPEPFNDGWNVPIPDDRMLFADRNPDAPCGSGQAYFEGVECFYRKAFDVPADWEGKRVGIYFEGIYKDPVICINGTEAARGGYGYLPVEVDAAPFLKYGEKNEITVSCSNADQPDSRWYTGAGIYKPVWLYVSEPAYIPVNGIRVSTQSVDPAVVRVSAEVLGPNAGKEAAKVEILDAKGKVAAKGLLDRDIRVKHAKLWSDENPYLYTCRVTLPTGESYTQTFGIRQVEASAEKGLLVNGKPVLLRGGCLHHSQGLLGAATFDESVDRQVRILKKAGYNAVRSSHNPAGRALLEACDKYGMYLMDESWDMWYTHKTAFDYASEWEKNHLEDLRQMVRLDYNHPSVIMYSIGNELTEPGKDKGVEYAGEIVDFLHREDPSRLVTCGINVMILYGSTLTPETIARIRSAAPVAITDDMDSQAFNEIASYADMLIQRAIVSDAADSVCGRTFDLLDVAGYNYGTACYDVDARRHPGRVIVGSETYPGDISKNWAKVKANPCMIGDFIWTAWDYVGEVGCGAWAYGEDESGFSKPYPWLLAGLPAFDLIGHAGPAVAQARAAWGISDKPWIGVRPLNHAGEKVTRSSWRSSDAMDTWSWKGYEGTGAEVEVFSRGAFVELFLNGESLGRQPVGEGDNTARFSCIYTPGVLKAVSYDADGTFLGESVLKSSDGNLQIGIHPEKENLEAGEICYVPINIEDASGVVESAADRKISVSVEGGTLLAFGSANPCTEERYTTGSFTTWYGRAMAIVKAGEDPGKLRITATAEGLGTSMAEFRIR